MTDAGFLPNSRDDLNELPALCRGWNLGRRDSTEAPAVANVGRLYGINSNRSRMQIIYDYAAVHDLSARQVEALVRELPGGSADVIILTQWRKA